MKMIRSFLLTVLLLSASLTMGQHTPIAGVQLNPLAPSEANLPKIKGAGNALSWEVLSKVSTKANGKRIVAHFPLSIMRYHQQEVTLVGYMMPLSQGQKQTSFLFSYSASTCNFCLPAGPEGVVEVKASTGVKISYEPIAIKGVLKVLLDDPGGMYYRLEKAIQIN
jgi:uncharacterized protein